MADDAGRLVDNVKAIDGFMFPETDDSARKPLGVLAQIGRILRYTAPNGQKCIQIVHWGRHQKVDHPNKYLLPTPPGDVLTAPQVPPDEVPAGPPLPASSRDPRENDASSFAKSSRYDQYQYRYQYQYQYQYQKTRFASQNGQAH